ncbi:amino-acid transporter arg-13 [Pyrenophora tritici-repentis Pt-1C-BFP]|uniref:Amino-acid transporter arg-13 n=1 Tax=Pyrenophora tritici-repentis (strain Pt-1C-BFP) TaxID=426418 RepID=B2WP42_PYRTR|nr:amino-acid transporter arg-13 [Pyrenophora tritici-repentis Pt-1C-BFP]EDU44802.1 amino-acid transporter arg-13 [Pyrenophora tritici-repentis Pt-1C-BFP]
MATVLYEGEFFKHVVSGFVAGAAGMSVEYPFDTVKFRLAQKILEADTEGAVFKSDFIVLRNVVLCGAASGAITSFLLNPIEMIKCNMQVLPETQAGIQLQRRGTRTTIEEIYCRYGMSGFWSGQIAIIIREAGGTAAWFGSYEGVKRSLQRITPQTIEGQLESLAGAKAAWQQVMAGACAGMGYTFSVYPADTVKSYMQTAHCFSQSQYSPSLRFLDVTSHLWQQFGLRGLYRGCSITIVKSAFGSALIFSVYERISKLLR